MERSNLKSFLKGYGGIFDIFTQNKEIDRIVDTHNNDYDAIKNDWKIVGEDLYRAIVDEREKNK